MTVNWLSLDGVEIYQLLVILRDDVALNQVSGVKYSIISSNEENYLI